MIEKSLREAYGDEIIEIIANGDTVNIAVSAAELLEINGITKEDIVKTAEELLK